MILKQPYKRLTYEQRMERLLHRYHLKYQRHMLKKDADSLRARMECAEIRRVKFRASRKMRETYAQTYHAHWFHHVRPNTIKAFIRAMADYSAQSWFIHN